MLKAPCPAQVPGSHGCGCSAPPGGTARRPCRPAAPAAGSACGTASAGAGACWLGRHPPAGTTRVRPAAQSTGAHGLFRCTGQTLVQDVLSCKTADVRLEQQHLGQDQHVCTAPTVQQSAVSQACCSVLRIRRGLRLSPQGLTVSSARPRLRPATHRGVEISQQVVRERRELAGPRVGCGDGDHLPRRWGWGGVHTPCGLADPSRHLPGSRPPLVQTLWALCTRQQRWTTTTKSRHTTTAR